MLVSVHPAVASGTVLSRQHLLVSVGSVCWSQSAESAGLAVHPAADMEAVQELMRGLAFRRDPRAPVSGGLAAAGLLGYMLLVAFGPRLMRSRPTPPLRAVMTIYNVGQIWISWYLCREVWLGRPSSWLCVPVEITEDARSLRLANAMSVFMLSKMVDFLDTVFMVLRKDHKRMTYFHVYHHSSVMFSGWVASAYAPGGSCWLPIMFNSSVHGVMYSYYLLASLGPRMRPFLWWKRYLTQLQMIQFGCIAGYTALIQTPGFRCGLPLWTCAMPFTYLVTLVPALLVTLSLQGGRSALSASHEPSVTHKRPVWGSFRHQVTEALSRHGLGCFVDHSAAH